MIRLMLRSSHPDYGTEDRSRECPVCASRGFRNVRHKHFSTSYQRQKVKSRGETAMNCAVCQGRHPADIETERIKSLFTSSTLFGHYKDPNWTGTDGYHMEEEAMGGAKLEFQRKVWNHIYKDVPMGIDTHVVSGLNDILQIINIPSNPALPLEEQIEVKTAVFMERIRSWWRTTKEHAARHGLETPNRFSVATVLRPPQLYRLPGNKNQWWVTHNDLIDSINRAIDDSNYEVRTEMTFLAGGGCGRSFKDVRTSG